MKTFKKWEKSKLDLDVYLGDTSCEIDEELANYIGECTIPYFCSSKFIQGGDPIYEEHNLFFYMTIHNINNRYWYLGILPQFKQ